MTKKPNWCVSAQPTTECGCVDVCKFQQWPSHTHPWLEPQSTAGERCAAIEESGATRPCDTEDSMYVTNVAAHGAAAVSSQTRTFAIGGTKPSNPKDIFGIKKVGLSAVSWPVLWELGVAMTEGACKYGRHNYRVIGVKASVYFDAVVSRHLGAWWEGEDTDADSGLSHITKAIASLVVLRDAMIRGNWVDDRPPVSDPKILPELNKKVEALAVKYTAPVAPYTEKAAWTPAERASYNAGIEAAAYEFDKRAFGTSAAIVRALKLPEPTSAPEFRNAVCRGSYALGTACGQCERCQSAKESKT